MITIPNISFEKHIENLIEFISKFDRSIKNCKLLFYFEKDVNRKRNTPRLEKTKIFDKEEFKTRFHLLCQEGREWINISGDAKIDDKTYLISCEYSNNLQSDKVAINISGPSTDISGKVDEFSMIKLV